MNTSRFLAEFGTIAAAPNGVQRLREMILQLAVMGKLVPQDPADEPASVLLQRIAAEKDRLIRDGTIKRPKPLPAIRDDEKPFELPHGWEWARLDHLALNSEAGWSPTCESTPREKGKWGVLKVSAVTWGEFRAEENKELPNTLAPKPEYEVKAGDFLISRANTAELVARAVIVPENIPEKLMLSDKIIRFVFTALANKNFINLVNSSSFARVYYARVAGGTSSSMKNVSREHIRNLVIALPPAKEQKRIVAKVDSLMALCDNLETLQQQRQQLDPITHNAVLQSLAQIPDDLQRAWQRLNQHMTTLFHTPESVKALRETILQLAVMGKLVPQDPNDEPAAMLLQHIATEKDRLIQAGKIKRQKPLPAIRDDEKPFELPNGWEWVRLDQLALNSEAGWSPTCESTPREKGKWGVLKVSAVTWGAFKPEENKELPNSLDPKPEYEVKAGDFLISRANTAELVARAVIVPDNIPDKLMLSDKIIRFVFTALANKHFINLINSSSFARNYYARVAGGTSSSMKNVSREQIRNLVIALPPAQEQQRIVAKVDSLMALCDKLETRLHAARETAGLFAVEAAGIACHQ